MNKESINAFDHEPTSPELLCRIRSEIPSFLTEKRLSHTLFVEKEALTLAKYCFLVYNVPEEYSRDVSAAALLHDITKKLTLGEQLTLVEKYGIEAVGHQRKSVELLHSKTAAFLAKDRYGINDVVFSAVYNHTTGKENMNLIDKIIFLADYIEPSRKHENCIQTREFFYANAVPCDISAICALDKAIIRSLDGTISHLIEKGAAIDVSTVLARNYMLSASEEKEFEHGKEK